MKKLLFILLAISPMGVMADIQQDIIDIESKMLEWRRHLHQNPELSNREFKTAAYIEKHLKALGLEVKTGVAHTGLVAFLEGGKPGPLLALRADMDALPVTEQVDLSFASKVTTEYRGETTGVMHACGHDTHVAILMAAAEIFTKNKADLAGSLMFIFQPAEEGAPGDEEGGAELMLAEGLFNDRKPEAVFGLHVTSNMNSGIVGFRKGPSMAAVDDFELKVIGRQAHGSRPWSGIDPIVTSAQIINSVQTIVSRRTDVTKAPAVVSFGAIKGGIRNNIIPDDVTMVGTIRNFDMGIRDDIHQQLGKIVNHVGQANDADIEFKINEGYPVTVNDPELGEKMLPSLHRVFGAQNVIDPGLITGAEDFSYFANEVPGMFFFMGVTPQDQNPLEAPTNHSPHFYVEETALLNGVKAFVQLVNDY
ncbi:amidohydrolase [Marinicella sp. S1101]|uniref:amidohydrolase n=1 Tax=Marinicella marina TaxID=2996016 RepID=UPI002260F00D|nr:amidohydrolase [Marinicella marina]MCX7553795.1 amidohydrolase [Marinicella marina]MDJ1140871.1 amidohydrolase [Marinicella marina]